MPSRPTVLERSGHLPFSADEVFRWHERPGALERLTPPWEQVDVLERSGGIEDGGRVVAKIGCAGRDHVGRAPPRLPARPPVRRRTGAGPLLPLGASSPLRAGRCRLVCGHRPYRIHSAAGCLGAASVPALVQPRLERLLGYRHEVLRRDLETHARFADRPRLRIAVTGASGFIGRALVPFLTTGGHDRRAHGAEAAAGPGRGVVGLGARPHRRRPARRAGRRGPPRGREHRGAVDAERPPPDQREPRDRHAVPERDAGAPRAPAAGAGLGVGRRHLRRIAATRPSPRPAPRSRRPRDFLTERRPRVGGSHRAGPRGGHPGRAAPLRHRC